LHPDFFKILLLCFETVCGLIKSISAISELDFPAAKSLMISVSLEVKLDKKSVFIALTSSW